MYTKSTGRERVAWCAFCTIHAIKAIIAVARLLVANTYATSRTFLNEGNTELAARNNVKGILLRYVFQTTCSAEQCARELETHHGHGFFMTRWRLDRAEGSAVSLAYRGLHWVGTLKRSIETGCRVSAVPTARASSPGGIVMDCAVPDRAIPL